MNIKKNDNVIMLSGKDRGKKGKVLHVYPEDGKVRIEGLNMVKKHQRPKSQGQKGQIISIERRVAISSIQLICPQCGKPTRIGHIKQADVKMRVCKKCKTEFK